MYIPNSKVIKKSPKHILVAPLDWGLGHATRCIPIIKALLSHDARISLASSGRAGALLRSEFPSLAYFELPAYDIQYPSDNMYWNMGLQLPKLVRAIFAEKHCIKELAKAHSFDAIVSDNRFGCFHPRIQSVFITHQLHIEIPNPITRKIVAKVNQSLIRRYNACWIPDHPAPYNLAGKLSDPPVHSATQYLGTLSRMKTFDEAPQYDIVAVLSGPEPQRSIFEQQVLHQLKVLPQKTLVVQGKPDIPFQKTKVDQIEVVSFLGAEALNHAILASHFVICRSGYSSIMDLIELKKKALLIPTPGQTEQEYLAEQLCQKGIFLKQKQKNLDIGTAFEKRGQFSGLANSTQKNDRLESVIQQFLSSLEGS